MSFRFRTVVLLLGMVAMIIGGCKEDPIGNEDVPPGSPQSLRVNGGTTKQPRAIFSWSPPADSTGITGYRVWWRKNAVAGPDSMDVDGATRSVQIVVEKDLPYTFLVAARRGDRMSNPASIQWGGWLALQPASDLRASLSGPGAATLEWAPSPDSNVTGYAILAQNLNSNETKDTAIDGRTSRTFSFAGISEDQDYLFVLYARNGERISAPVTVELLSNLPAPAPPEQLEVSSVTGTSVRIRWNPSRDTGTITYRVSWREANQIGGDSVTIDASSATLALATGLSAGRAYRFSVVAVRRGKESSPAGIVWAGAERYTNDGGNPSAAIRIYETASANGAGLTLDPAKGGPKNVGMGSSNSDPGSVQLAIYTSASNPNNFEIGPAYAFTEYRNADRFDQNTFVSDVSVLAHSLDSWYFSGSIQEKIPSNGNLRAFMFPAVETGPTGQGFYVRTGAAGNYHYARVFIKKVAGKFLQGTAPNRYVELEISYQSTANLPFAKTAGRGASPAGVSSYVRR